MKENTLVSEFDFQISSFFEKNKIPLTKKVTVCLGVSGGADSISLLVSLCHLSLKKGFPLKIISVNHKIRSDEESDFDCEYVKKLCEKFKKSGIDVECEIYSLKRGEVFACAKERANGIEEAARFLRYKAFLNFAEKHNSSIFCVAHNKNDQCETLLMRFLQGSRGGLQGIYERRGIFYRPLLNVSRSQIEEYLNFLNIKWVTDSTNNCEDYLRNKIRLKLIPFLNEFFPGWQKAVLSGGKKALADEVFLRSCSDSFEIQSDFSGSEKKVYFPFDSFKKLPEAIKTRVLYRAFDLFMEEKRISFGVIEEFLNKIERSDGKECDFFENISDWSLTVKNNVIFIKKKEKIATEKGFSAIIENEGTYNFPFGSVKVEKDLDGIKIIFYANGKSLTFCEKSFPFCIKSRETSDEVKTSFGKYKNVSDVFTDWHVKKLDKDLIPLVQELYSPLQEIKFIPGTLFGYKDWVQK